eukprot:CAMPEP_0194365520 /NCGR_PEP_ID=MMETSP0174-20130528/13591_1 /TAXON_ID=216777 /ORGANISM="Proboscia alata, Strain PI-D3" /LENGTH=635 /DNA_ID=CAMNT_0039140271 /DNA_START=77 /DNA_END=1984 /DNA_ORIENTATION=+
MATDEDFVASEFEPSLFTESMHNMPRFGHTDDIGYAASSNLDVKEDYLLGVSFISGVIVLFLLVWVIVLIVMKFVGREQVGCASGEVSKIPSIESIQKANANNQYQNNVNSQNSGEDEGEGMNGVEISTSSDAKEDDDYLADIEQWQYESTSIEQIIRWARIIFLVFAGIVIVSSLAIILGGINVLNYAYISAIDNVQVMNTKIDLSIGEAAFFSSVALNASKERDLTLESIDSWCPNANINGTIAVTTSSDDNITYLSTGTSSDGLYSSLVDLTTFAVGGINSIEGSLVEAKMKGEDIKESMNNYAWWHLGTLGFILGVDFLVALFSIGVILAWKNIQPLPFEILQTYCALPLFAFLVSTTWLAAAGFAFTAVLTSDVCTGSPEENLVSIFNEQETDLDPLLYAMTKYYVEGCSLEDRPEKPTVFIDDFLPYLKAAETAMQTFSSEVSMVDFNNLVSSCGTDASYVTSAIDNIAQLTLSLNKVTIQANSTIQSLYCSEYNPVYVDMMHVDVCHFGVKGLSMTFISTLVLVVAGMVMMTLRASWHEVEDEDHWMNDECSIISENRKYSLAQVGSSMSDTRQPHAEEIESESDQNSAEHGIENNLSSPEPNRRQEPQVDEFGEDPMHNTLRSVAYR